MGLQSDLSDVKRKVIGKKYCSFQAALALAVQVMKHSLIAEQLTLS